MSPLTQLPAELRQRILLLVLPSTNRVESPANFIHLAHINRLLRNDFQTALTVWTPIHYISHPSTLTSRFPPTRGHNLSRICLDLFSTAFLGRIAWNARTINQANYTHPELIELWSNAVPFLDKKAREVFIDVTPAPAEKRQPPAERDVFVSNDFAARRFLRGHVRDVAALVRRIDEDYAGRARIVLTGHLSTRSSFFVRALDRRVGRQLSFVGTWISAADARCAHLTAAVTERTLCPRAREGKKCGTHTLSWLSGVRWSQKTGLVYSRIARTGYGYAVIKDVEIIAELFTGCRKGRATAPRLPRPTPNQPPRVMKEAPRAEDREGVLLMLPDSRLFRAFQHCVATDLGLETKEEEVEEGRRVVVWSQP